MRSLILVKSPPTHSWWVEGTMAVENTPRALLITGAQLVTVPRLSEISRALRRSTGSEQRKGVPEPVPPVQ